MWRWQWRGICIEAWSRRGLGCTRRRGQLLGAGAALPTLDTRVRLDSRSIARCTCACRCCCRKLSVVAALRTTTVAWSLLRSCLLP